MREIHPVNRCNHGRRHEYHRQHGKNLDRGILLDVDHAQRGIEQERHFLRHEAGVFADGMNITRQRFQMLAITALILYSLPGHKRQITTDAIHAHQALAQIRNQITLAAQLLQQLLIGTFAASLLRLVKDMQRDGVNVTAGALQNIGQAVDHRLQQTQQQRGWIRQLKISLGGTCRESRKSTRIATAHGNQTFCCQHKTDRCHQSVIIIALCRQGRGHEIRPLLMIQATGNFNFLHFILGRNIDTQSPLQLTDNISRRIEQIDPDQLIEALQWLLDSHQALLGKAIADHMHTPAQ